MSSSNSSDSTLSPEVTRAALCPSSAQQPQHKGLSTAATRHRQHTQPWEPLCICSVAGEAPGIVPPFSWHSKWHRRCLKTREIGKLCFKDWYHLHFCALCLQHARGRKRTTLLQARKCFRNGCCMYWCTDCCAGREELYLPQPFWEEQHTHSEVFPSQRQPLLDCTWSIKFSTDFILQSQKRPTSSFLYLVTGRRAPSPTPHTKNTQRQWASGQAPPMAAQSTWQWQTHTHTRALCVLYIATIRSLQVIRITQLPSANWRQPSRSFTHPMQQHRVTSNKAARPRLTNACSGNTICSTIQASFKRTN